MPLLRSRALAFLALLLAAPAGYISAQQVESVPVVLQVTDATGAAIPYAEIRMIPSPKHSSNALETDAHGRLDLSLKPGGYCVSVASLGFRTLEEHFDVQGAKTIPFKLMGGCVECMAVSQITPDALLLRTVPYEGHPPVLLKPKDMRELPHVSVSVRNPHTNADETYSGAPLIELLERLGVPHGHELRGSALSEYVVATGSDGYRVVLALAELDPDFHPGQVIVADTMNGKPLDSKTGPFKLVVTEDKHPARSVHSLVSIVVKRAE